MEETILRAILSEVGAQILEGPLPSCTLTEEGISFRATRGSGEFYMFLIGITFSIMFHANNWTISKNLDIQDPKFDSDLVSGLLDQYESE